MPVSKKRKKKGKVVKRGEDRMSHLTLQDLINVVAYQEAHPEEAQSGGAAEIQTVNDIDLENPDHQAVIKAVQSLGEHTVFADDAVVHIPEVVPVTVGEGENKREIGTASPIPGDPDHLSINITDREILDQLEGPSSYSIDKEN